jgi:hypothetical protein
MTHRDLLKRTGRFAVLFFGVITCLCAAASVWAQADRGKITGTVTDTTGAVIPSVEVTATQVSTNTQYMAVSNEVGLYTVVNLPIGSYRITFKRDGFESIVQSGIVILANHTAEVNAQMKIGAAAETVRVNATPILEMQPEVGTNLTQDEVNELPLSLTATGGGRDQLMYAFDITPNVGGDSWYSSVNGSQQYTKNVLLDGTSIDAGVVGDLLETGPSNDAIEQVQVNTTGIRAEEARSGGGVFMVELKSGSNQWHGSAFAYGSNEDLNANTWDNNWFLSQCGSSTTCSNGNPRSAYARARDRNFDYGFSGGGPLWKNHTFFYTAYEKYWQDDWRTNPTGATAPTAQMLNGDFSQLLSFAATARGCSSNPCPTGYKDSAGNPIYYGAIFLPNGTVAPGNVIPSGMISPIAQKILAIYEQNYKPTGTGIVNNFPSIISNDPHFAQYQYSIKVDHNISATDKFAASYIYNHRPKWEMENATGMWIPGTHNGGPLTSNSSQELHTNAYRFSETHIFSPNILNVLSFTFNQFQNIQSTLAPQADYSSKLGLNSQYADKTSNFPQIYFNGAPNGVGEATIGSTWTGGSVPYNGIVNESLSWSKGRHDMKFGGELRAIGMNSSGGQQGGFSFNFNQNTYEPYQTDANFVNDVAPFVGFGLANMELGAVSSGSQGVPAGLYGRRKEYSLFAQDDYKVNRKLTVSMDLRWDVTGAYHEINGHWANFDLNAHDPNFGTLKGANVWLKHPGDTFETVGDYHQFGPHLGFSYRVTSKSVARASYGVMYSPVGNNIWGGVPYGYAPGYQGYNVVNPVGNSSEGQVLPAFLWDSSYPGVTVKAGGPMPNQGFLNWDAVTIDPHSRQLGMVENAFIGYEYQVTSDMKIDVNYNGAFGRNLHDALGTTYNWPEWDKYQRLLISGHANDWVSDQASAQTAGVTLPYQGWQHYAYSTLMQYPQVASAWSSIYPVNPPIGRSGYNAFTVEATKRGKNGLSMDLSFNHWHSTGNVCDAFQEEWWLGPCNLQNPFQYNDKKYWGSGTSGTGIKGYASYQLPVGRGRWLMGGANRVVDAFVGGWGVGTIVSYFNGGNMGWVGSTNSYPGWSGVWANVAPHANFKNQFKKWNPLWDPGTGATDSDSVFVNPNNFSNPEFGQLGNSPKNFQDWRGWAVPNENATLTKKFHFGESSKYTASLRADFFNLFNHHYWDNPNMDMSSPYFGHVTGVWGNRTGQVSARFQF